MCTGAAPLVRGVLWTGLVAACYWAAEVCQLWRVPAPQLMASLAIGAGLALGGLVRRPFPERAGHASQALVGVLIGSGISAASLSPAVLPLSAVTALTIAICVAVAAVLARSPRVSMTTAALAMSPGGSAAVVSSAPELGADGRVVALAQYIRVGLVAASAPLVVAALGAGHVAQPPPLGAPTLGGLVAEPSGLGHLLTLPAVCVAGSVLGRRLRLPSRYLLGPLLLAAAITTAGVSHGFGPAGPLRDVVLVIIGLDVGLRFTRDALRSLGRLLPLLVAATAAVCVLCAVTAWVLAPELGVPFVDAYLATTPGGINAVLGIAASTHTDVALVSAVQTLRLIVVAVSFPLVLHWWAHHGSRRGATEDRRRTVRRRRS